MADTTRTVELNLLDITCEQEGEEDRNFVCNRANIGVYIEYPDYEEKHSGEECKVVMRFDARWAYPMCWIEMTADETRQLAVILNNHAMQIEAQSFEREPEEDAACL